MYSCVCAIHAYMYKLHITVCMYNCQFKVFKIPQLYLVKF